MENRDKKILCIDLGTKTGWAYSKGTNLLSGTISFKNGRYEGGGMRFVRFLQWLEEMYQLGIDRVYFEEVRNHKGVDASHVYGGFLGTLSSWCEQKKIAYAGVPVGSIKKFATGKGNANKEMVINAVEKLGYKPSDDNEADAIALSLYCTDEVKL